MPVIEYVNSAPDPRLCQDNPLRRPFSLLVDHLEFVWSIATRVSLDPADAANPVPP
jgi:hypothetical protein